MSVISMKQLLEAGVHFGHQTRRWNPKEQRNRLRMLSRQKQNVAECTMLTKDGLEECLQTSRQSRAESLV